MTIEEIKKRVEEIKDKAWDDESAHSMEDKLAFDFIRLVAESNGPLSEHAKEVLKTQQIEFCRWCA